MKTKELIRQEIAARRNLLSADEVLLKSKEICNKLIKETAYQNADTVLLFSSFRNEVETKFLQKDALEKKKKIFYPKIIGTELFFYQINSATELENGYMGILEPLGNTTLFENTSTNTLVVVPGLCFDYTGNRLGYGKGYYDRFLSENNRLYTIAPAYEFQMFKTVVSQKHDQKIACIVTEKNNYYS